MSREIAMDMREQSPTAQGLPTRGDNPMSPLLNLTPSTARWVRFLAEPRTRREAEKQLSFTRRTAQRHLADLVSLGLALRGADHRYRLTDTGQALLVRLGGDTRLSPPSELGTARGDTGMSPLEQTRRHVGTAQRFLLALDSPKTRAMLETELTTNRRTVQRNLRRLVDVGLVLDDDRTYRRVDGWEALLDGRTTALEEPRLPEHVAEQAVSVEPPVPASTVDMERLRAAAARNVAIQPKPRSAPQSREIVHRQLPDREADPEAYRAAVQAGLNLLSVTWREGKALRLVQHGQEPAEALQVKPVRPVETAVATKPRNIFDLPVWQQHQYLNDEEERSWKELEAAKAARKAAEEQERALVG